MKYIALNCSVPYPYDDLTQDIRSNIPSFQRELVKMKAEGAPKGKRLYWILHLDLSHTTDSLTFLIINMIIKPLAVSLRVKPRSIRQNIPLRQFLCQRYGINTPKVTNTLDLTFVMI